MGKTKNQISQSVRLARQINYSIIRAVWKKTDRCGKFKNVSLDVIGIPRSRYSLLLAGRNAGVSKSDLIELSKTGASDDIFLGNRQLQIEGITDDNWETFFSEEYDKTKGEKQPPKTATYLKVKKALHGLNGDYIKTHYRPDNDIHKLYIYFLSGSAVEGSSETIAIHELSNQLANITWGSIKSANRESLETYESALRDQVELLTAFRLYQKHSKA